MSGRFAFDEDVTVSRVVSNLGYGTIFLGETHAGAEVRVRFYGGNEMPVVGDTFNVKGTWSSFTDKFRRVHRQIETTEMEAQGGPWRPAGAFPSARPEHWP